MIIIRGTAQFAPGEIERLRPQLDAYLDHVRQREGCLDYHFAVDVRDPTVIHAIQAWRDQAAHDAYMADLGEVMAILAGSQVVQMDIRAYEGRFVKNVLADELTVES